MEGMQEESKEFALATRPRGPYFRRCPHKPDVNHQGEHSASLNRCSAVAARVGRVLARRDDMREEADVSGRSALAETASEGVNRRGAVCR